MESQFVMYILVSAENTSKSKTFGHVLYIGICYIFEKMEGGEKGRKVASKNLP